MNKVIRQIGIFLLCYLFFVCSKLVSSHGQEKSFCVDKKCF